MTRCTAPLRRVAGDREGPGPQGWESEVAFSRLRRCPATHLTPTLSARKRAEREECAA